MRTFIEGVGRLTGKRVFVFVTYAVSSFGRVLDDYRQLYPDATWGRALAIRGEEVNEREADVRSWLVDIGLR